MRTVVTLDRLLRSIASLVATTAAVTACSSGVSKSGVDQNVCSNGTLRLIEGVEPKEPVDYMEVRIWGSFTGPPGKGQSSFTVTEARGAKCARASDRAKCEKALDGVENPKSGLRGVEGQLGSVTTIAYTRGDEVGSVKNEAELKAFLSMRSIKDAALLAWSRGYDIPCSDGDNAGVTADGFLVVGRTGDLCGGNVDEHRLHVMRTGEIFVEETKRYEDGDPGCAIGRRPDGLADVVHVERDTLAGWLARVAHLEAASIPAFERLAADLERLGAPAELVSRAKESADDERRHAASTAALARAHGGVVPAVELAAHAACDLLSLARENAAEGCVRETFGALFARVQATRAETPELCALFDEIARDETAHAALAWDIDAWARGSLSPEECREVERARRDAVRALFEGVTVPLPAEVVARLGAPQRDEARAMAAMLDHALWAA